MCLCRLYKSGWRGGGGFEAYAWMNVSFPFSISDGGVFQKVASSPLSKHKRCREREREKAKNIPGGSERY